MWYTNIVNFHIPQAWKVQNLIIEKLNKKIIHRYMKQHKCGELIPLLNLFCFCKFNFKLLFCDVPTYICFMFIFFVCVSVENMKENSIITLLTKYRLDLTGVKWILLFCFSILFILMETFMHINLALLI